MRIHKVFAGLALATILATFPLAAAEPPAASETAVNPAAAPTLPAELEGLLTPEPVKLYGIKYGPCTVSVSCPGGVISCSGQSICYWKLHGPTTTGFVECDGSRTTCELL